MSYWMMTVLAASAVLAFGLMFTVLIVALDKDEFEDAPASESDRWTSVI